MRFLSVAAVAVVMLCATAVHADDNDGKTERKPGERGRRPGAGQFNREEFMKRYDLNGDGKIDDEERAKMREAMMARMLESERGKELLKKYDADGDGKLNAEEMAKLREEMGARRGRGGPGGERGAGRPGFDREALLKKYDANGDGKLDDAERAKMREDFQNRRGERPRRPAAE